MESSKHTSSPSGGQLLDAISSDDSRSIKNGKGSPGAAGYSQISPSKSLLNKRRDEISELEQWSQFGDNHKLMPRPRITQDYGRILNNPGPSYYKPRPELLSTEETLPKHSISVTYPPVIFGEKDIRSYPAPHDYELPSAVKILDGSTKFHPPILDESAMINRVVGPSPVKYEPSYKTVSRYERFPSAIMPTRERLVKPRSVVDLRNLSVYESFGKAETSAPGTYHSDILKKDPRDTRLAPTIGIKLKDLHPEGLDYCRPAPGDHDPDIGLFGPLPLQDGFAFPSPVRPVKHEVFRSNYASPSDPAKKIFGKWVGVARRDEKRKNMKSDYGFRKSPVKPRLATGRNCISTVQNMEYHFPKTFTFKTLRK